MNCIGKSKSYNEFKIDDCAMNLSIMLNFSTISSCKGVTFFTERLSFDYVGMRDVSRKYVAIKRIYI